MNTPKRKRLEAVGWNVGSSTDFLELPAEQAAFVELKLRLSQSLRKRRQGQKLSQDSLARKIRSSQSRVAKMEAGDQTVSIDPLIRALLATGATDRDLARAVAPSGE